MAKQWKTWKKESVLKEGTMRKIIWNMLANQPLFHQKKNDKNFAAIHEKKKNSFNTYQTNLCWVCCSWIK